VDERPATKYKDVFFTEVDFTLITTLSYYVKIPSPPGYITVNCPVYVLYSTGICTFLQKVATNFPREILTETKSRYKKFVR
jgi:hypothetical protein